MEMVQVAFPEDYKNLVPRVLSETMVTIGTRFISRINLTIGDPVPEIKVLAIGLLDTISCRELKTTTAVKAIN